MRVIILNIFLGLTLAIGFFYLIASVVRPLYLDVTLNLGGVPGFCIMCFSLALVRLTSASLPSIAMVCASLLLMLSCSKAKKRQMEV